jgi:transcriptional regulator with XRE-family HTH domain
MTASDTDRDLSATFARNLRTARRDAGLTQRELARHIGIGEMRISDWERGIHRPNDNNFTAVCRALNQSPGWFWDNHEEATA